MKFAAREAIDPLPISECTEISSIGVTLYQAITGSFPYGEIERLQTPAFRKRPEFDL